MSLTKRLLPILLWGCAALPATSYALACYEDPSMSVAVKQPLGAAIAVPADVPNGTIIWESGPQSINVMCEDDYKTGSEQVYFWVNPAKATVGQGIRVGIRYKNTPLTGSAEKYGTGFYSVKKGKAYFTLNYSVYIEKYGTTPTNGQATTVSEYRVFQLDGVRALSSRPEKNLNYYVTGMNTITFMPCLPELTITPSVVNFPTPSRKAQIGAVASTANFALSLRKSCSTPFTIDARFATTAGGGSVIDGLLVPDNNSSVGISVSRAESQTPLPFNNWFTLQQLMGKGSIQNDFRADLKWRSAPVPGPFEAAVVVDMLYK